MKKFGITISAGILSGIILGGFTVAFRFIEKVSFRRFSYLCYIVSLTIVIPLISELIGYPDIKYISLILSCYILSLISE